MPITFNHIKKQDPELYAAIQKELQRQRQNIVLIASENYVSTAVLEAVGSQLTNKYAEGYPGKRYYGGCEFVDIAEELAISRAKQLFKVEHANVQPHSGAQANMAAYMGVLDPGDTIMGMRLDQGGHLTHGSPVNFSGKLFKIVSYGVDKETERLDYAEIRKVAREHKPKLIVAGATAYPREIDWKQFREIADEVGAMFMTDIAHTSGLIAAGVHPSPVPYAHIVTTSTHKSLRGPRGGMIMCTESMATAIDRGVFPRAQGGPLMHVIAGKAVAFGEALRPEFVDYQKGVKRNAAALAAELQVHGFRIVSGGTDNHLVLMDLTPVGLTGAKAEEVLESVHITANKNAIPFDTQGPRITSGLRLGTPAVTTRGFDVTAIKEVARLIGTALHNIGIEKVLAQVREDVIRLTSRFPVPGQDD